MFSPQYTGRHNYHEADRTIHPDYEGQGVAKGESAPLKSHGLLSQIHSRSSFEAIKIESKKSWITLPASVNGTLIYFLVVENNTRTFSLWEFFQCLVYVGFPVYFTFYLQALLLWTLWVNVPSFSTDENICGTSPFVQHAVIGIFLIFLIPSGLSITRESLCVLKCDRVAFEQEDDCEKIVIYKLVNSDMKKLLTFCLIIIPESLILLSLFYVGSGFM